MDGAHGKQGDESASEPFVPDFSEGLESGLYLALLELVDEGLIITGDEVVLEANSAACTLLEREYREIVGQPLARLFPSDRDFIHARARLFIQGEMRGSLQLALPGGRARNLRFVAAARIRPGIHALILSRDLLAEREQAPASPTPDALWPRLAAVLEQPVIVIDEQAHVSAANAAALSGLNLERDRLIGHALDSCIAVHWPKTGSTPLARLTRSDGTVLVARVLPGPKPGWRVLVLPVTGRRGGATHRPVRPADSLRLALAAVPAQPPTPDAIENKQLEIHFQPLVDARSGRVQGGEALLRWHHPTHGLTPFGRIASLVDDPDSIASMSDWALQAACKEAARWVPDGGSPKILTVNVARGQLIKGDLIKRVETALAASGLAAKRLELDFDESILTDDEDTILGILGALSELGVQLAIDDFGRGSTSIPRLRRYPLAAIKLDPALVRQVGHDEASESIVEAISSMAGVLGLKVFARGVERPPQQAFLSALGCHLQQGPLFGAPMSTDAFAASLAPAVPALYETRGRP